MTWKIELIETHIEVENQHLMEEMLATLADEDPIRDEIAGKRYVGRDQVAGRYAELWKSFPNFNVSPTRYTEQDNRVVMEALYTGTHLGVFNGFQPTAKSFELRLINVFTFTETKIESETIFIDYASQLRQLDLLDV